VRASRRGFGTRDPGPGREVHEAAVQQEAAVVSGVIVCQLGAGHRPGVQETRSVAVSFVAVAQTENDNNLEEEEEGVSGLQQQQQ
jgi:hypothetical protein